MRHHDEVLMDDEVVRVPCFVATVRQDRAFGGPEEGGWWYATQEVVEVHYCATLAVLCRVMARVQDKYMDVSRYPVSSVCSGGVYLTRIGQEIPSSYPDQRPHYE